MQNKSTKTIFCLYFNKCILLTDGCLYDILIKIKRSICMNNNEITNELYRNIKLSIETKRNLAKQKV